MVFTIVVISIVILVVLVLYYVILSHFFADVSAQDTGYYICNLPSQGELHKKTLLMVYSKYISRVWWCS